MLCMQRLLENHRPKGLCGWQCNDVGSLLTLVIVGQVINNAAISSVLVPSSVTADYQLSLQLRSCESLLPLPMSLLSYEL